MKHVLFALTAFSFSTSVYAGSAPPAITSAIRAQLEAEKNVLDVSIDWVPSAKLATVLEILKPSIQLPNMTCGLIMRNPDLSTNYACSIPLRGDRRTLIFNASVAKSGAIKILENSLGLSSAAD